MTINIDLTREEQERLQRKASELGVQPEDYIHQLIQRDSAAEFTTLGQRLLQQWESDGVLGLFQDRPDSPEFARELRRQAEQRG